MAASYFGFWLFRRDSLVGRFLRWLEGLRNPWIDSTGDNALNALETQLLGQCARLRLWRAVTAVV